MPVSRLVLVPEKNRPDVEEISAGDHREDWRFVFVEQMDQVLKACSCERIRRTDYDYKKCRHWKRSAVLQARFRKTSVLEVAFAGKSNVGKSSLINGLMNRKALARTSSQPGKTQTINFYNVNDEVYLVDLPGYGYAKVSQAEKEKWGKLIENYLHKSSK